MRVSALVVCLLAVPLVDTASAQQVSPNSFDWTAEPECSDGIDNDGDAAIDFPEDPGCSSAEDETEFEDGVIHEDIRYARTVRISQFRHGTGKRDQGLLLKGRVESDGSTECVDEVPVGIQIQADGDWITRKTGSTGIGGAFSFLMRDVPRRFRAVAPRLFIEEEANSLAECIRAFDARRHSH